MKTIIVPTDFSDLSKDAAFYAVDFAGSVHASVSLLHVCAFPTAALDIPFPENTLTVMHEDAEAAMLKLKEEIKEYAHGEVEIFTNVRHGYFITELKEYCSSVHPYAVVMSSHGGSGLQRFLLGSNTVTSLKHLSWPLLIIPAGARYNHIKKIALACDMKDVAATLPTSFLEELIHGLNAQLYVVHVNTSGESNYEKQLVEESFDLQHLLQPLHPIYHFLDEVEVEPGLIAFTEKFNIDLLIMLPKKHSLLDKLFHESHSKTMALHAHLPVMNIHQQD